MVAVSPADAAASTNTWSQIAIRMVVQASRSEGYAKFATLTETDQEDLKAARLSLGTLGAISEITFALEQMFKSSVSASVRDDYDLENEADRFLKGVEFRHINWIPSHGKALFFTSYHVPVDAPGNGFKACLGSPARVADIETRASQEETNKAKEDVDAMCNALEEATIAAVDNGSGFFNDQNIFKGYPVVGFNHRMQTSGGCEGTHPGHEYNPEICTPTQILDKIEIACSSDCRLHTNLYFDVELRLPLSQIWEVINDLKKLRSFDPVKFC
ncbi:hypothetical protein KI387_032021, partial [Taxus chinensis]